MAAGRDVFPDEPRQASADAESRRDRLTARETQVLSLVAEGFPTRKIAEQLGISPRTVEAHRRVITQKIGEKKLAGLVRYAIRRGLVSA